MDDFTRADLCPSIYELLAQKCTVKGLSGEEISIKIQNEYGGDAVYSVLAKQLGVCLSKIVYLKLDQEKYLCDIYYEDILRVCKPTENWELIVITIDIEDEAHANTLLINHKLRIVEHFDPFGSESIIYCDKSIRKWIKEYYNNYFIVKPEDICPVGPQNVLGGGTCYMWSLLYFYLRLRCSKTDPSVLTEALLSLPRQELIDLLVRFGCYIIEIGDKLQLGMVKSLYYISRNILIENEFNSTAMNLVDQLERYYTSAETIKLLRTILSSNMLMSKLEPYNHTLIEKAKKYLLQSEKI